MEELKPQHIEELMQELEEAESGAQESLPLEVAELLRVLQSGTCCLARAVGVLPNALRCYGRS